MEDETGQLDEILKQRSLWGVGVADFIIFLEMIWRGIVWGLEEFEVAFLLFVSEICMPNAGLGIKRYPSYMKVNLACIN